MAEIDTPEKRQPYGQRAKQALARLVYRKQVRIEPVDRDRYGWIVGQVYVGDQWINQIMVCQRQAWVYRRYATSRALVACEDEARAAKRGLWALSEAQRQPPWEWRREKKRDAPALESSEVDRSAAIDCTRRWTCRMFRSCEEAQALFHQCGQRSLDGDRNGIPCERLCRNS
ncbi:MAG: nuclease [Nitrospirae bacterium]|nr:MAG: nuclease [Nitrospirota bacterium]